KNEVENLQRGTGVTGVGGASREQMRQFVRKFLELTRRKPGTPGSLPANVRRGLQKEFKEIRGLMNDAPPRIEEAFEAVMRLRDRSFDTTGNAGGKSSPTDTKPADKDD